MRALPMDQEAFERSVLRRRWLNALRRTGITTVGQLRVMSEKRLLEIPMIGPEALVDIVEALGDRSVCATDSIEALGLPPARVISERDSQLVRMRQQGATIAVIARRFGISQVRVSQILDRDGW
ncbi:MAG: DNA-directed RNA polymerase subunit alpha C-terminal domain-containing protein [Solirubrobacteraceae bacterium]